MQKLVSVSESRFLQKIAGHPSGVDESVPTAMAPGAVGRTDPAKRPSKVMIRAPRAREQPQMAVAASGHIGPRHAVAVMV